MDKALSPPTYHSFASKDQSHRDVSGAVSLNEVALKSGLFGGLCGWGRLGETGGDWGKV